MKQFFYFIVGALIAMLVSESLQISQALGFLLMGLIMGPSCLDLLSNHDVIIHYFSEIGFILFMFHIGLELPFNRLKHIVKQSLYWGSLQVACTSSVLFLCLSLLTTWNLTLKIIMSLGISLSSTALIVNLLKQDKPLEKYKTWKSLFPILIFQDIVAVVLLIFLNIFKAMQQTNDTQLIYKEIGLHMTIFILALIVTFFVLQNPRLQEKQLLKDDKTTMTALMVLAMGFAMLTENARVSYELGGFMSGIMCAELFDIHPIESVLSGMLHLGMSAFFIQIGTQMDFSFIVEHGTSILFTTFMISSLKAGVLVLLGYYHGFSWMMMPKFAIPLSGMSEFMFIIIQKIDGLSMDKLSSQILFNSTALSMMLTSLIWFMFTIFKIRREKALQMDSASMPSCHNPGPMRIHPKD